MSAAYIQVIMWDHPGEIKTWIGEHVRLRPAMETRDLYKLLYQAVRGPEHLFASPNAFGERLRAEWAALENDLPDPLYEAIRIDGSLLRVNLRPYRAADGQLEALAESCLQTANRHWGGRDDVKRIWGRLGAGWADLAAAYPGLADYTALTTWLEAENYPAVHHSESYRKLYRPAYRLIAADLLPGIDPLAPP